jgi:mannobiose 2-epimerase
MKNPFNCRGMILTAAVLCSMLAGCRSHHHGTYLGVSVRDIESELSNLLSNWYPRIIDTIHGGYWTNFEYDWTRSTEQDKMLVTQARGLWTAARAYIAFPDSNVFKKAADHGFQFLTQHMWDEKNGGFYLYYHTDSLQKIGPVYKLVYGNAFALYALSEYAKISKDPDVLQWVRKSFGWIEKYAHDSVCLGYYSLVFPENTDASGRSEGFASLGGPGGKDQNTSIHLLEALTNTYQVLPEEPVRKRLEEMLKLVRDTMMDDEGSLHLFFNKTWDPVINRDSSHAFILKNIGLDHISFGHNIETAYLLHEASEVLYGKPDSVTLIVATRMIDHTLAGGFGPGYYGLYEKGYHFKGETNIEIIDSVKTWWAQAEAWHALALFAGLYPEKSIYRNAFMNMWNYIKNEVIDHQYGGWYNNGLDTDPGNKTARKAHQWKGCYHNGRALMQVMQYARKGTRDNHLH